jgi:hypothetical protein
MSYGIWLLAGAGGWCGTGWLMIWLRQHIPHGGGGGAGLQPGDWGPPGCLVCNRIYGLIGGILTVPLITSQFPNAGLIGTAVAAVIGGAFLGDVGNMVTSKFMKG